MKKSITKSEPTQERIQEIERLTRGKIGTHRFGPNLELTLDNSFLSPAGQYIGDFELAEWYCKNHLMVDEQHPHGVAALITKETYGSSAPIIEAMYGYTHRGGQLFKIGDRIFDQDYTTQESGYPTDEWANYKIKYDTCLAEAEDFEKDWIIRDGLSYVIPFNRRGRLEIKTMEDAFIAARNLSNYLS